MAKFKSTKFIVTLMIVLLGVGTPVIFAQNQVPTEITMAVLALLSGVGIAYGILNVKAEALRNKEQDK